MRHLLLWILVSLYILSACGGSEAMEFPEEKKLTVIWLTGNENPKQWVLQPSNENYARLKTWIDKNKNGWRTYLSTTPGTGLVIEGSNIRLQFIGRMVIACKASTSCVQKTVNADEYSFLFQQKKYNKSIF